MVSLSTAVLRSGRPRDPGVEGIVINAVLDLVDEGSTLAGLSLVAIAKRAGVSRNSLYRRWKVKEDLYLDVLGSINRPLPKESTGNVRRDLARQLSILATRVLDQRARHMLRALSAESDCYPELRRRYYEEILAPRRRALEAAIARGIASGEFQADVDVDLFADLLVAPLLARMVSGNVVGLDADVTSRAIVDFVIQGATTR